jgi:hypothetical protein
VKNGPKTRFYKCQRFAAADTGAVLLWRVRSNIRLPVLELLPDGSYRSVLVWPRATPKQREALIEAACRGDDLDPDRARPVRVVEYEVTDREGDGKDELTALVTTITDRRRALLAAATRAGRPDSTSGPSTRAHASRPAGELRRTQARRTARTGRLALRSTKPTMGSPRLTGAWSARPAARRSIRRSPDRGSLPPSPSATPGTRPEPMPTSAHARSSHWPSNGWRWSRPASRSSQSCTCPAMR